MLCSSRFCVSTRHLFTTTIAGLLLVSCGAPQLPSSLEAPMNQASAPTAAPDLDRSASADAGVPADTNVAAVPRSQPQLVKTAQLTVTVPSVQEAIDQIEGIVRQQQGDLLGLQDQTPPHESSRHTATLQIRVPQAKLEAALEALKRLGTIQQQSLAATDVANQLVDYQSRLRNLRKAEETLLEIMDRSGGVADVLKVAQELSNVRNSIEQINGQLSQLQTQVAYSTINLLLEEPIATIPPQRSVQIQLQETWESATYSLGKVTVDLLQLGIWLLVYSPYWLVLGGGAALGYSQLRARQASSVNQRSEET